MQFLKLFRGVAPEVPKDILDDNFEITHNDPTSTTLRLQSGDEVRCIGDFCTRESVIDDDSANRLYPAAMDIFNDPNSDCIDEDDYNHPQYICKRDNIHVRYDVNNPSYTRIISDYGLLFCERLDPRSKKVTRCSITEYLPKDTWSEIRNRRFLMRNRRARDILSGRDKITKNDLGISEITKNNLKITPGGIYVNPTKTWVDCGVVGNCYHKMTMLGDSAENLKKDLRDLRSESECVMDEDINGDRSFTSFACKTGENVKPKWFDYIHVRGQKTDNGFVSVIAGDASITCSYDKPECDIRERLEIDLSMEILSRARN